jgi:hypothetical protein
MNLSELFIRRPVMTVLLNLSIVVAGILAYRYIPIAALPSYDTPVISVNANLPGASPETMATSVALPLKSSSPPSRFIDYQFQQYDREYFSDAGIRSESQYRCSSGRCAGSFAACATFLAYRYDVAAFVSQGQSC